MTDPLPPASPVDPATLRYLRILVTVLTATMIGGLITIIALLVIRVPQAVRVVDDPVPLPAGIALPDGTTATAFTRGPDWFAVVTDDDTILILDAETGAVTQTITIAH